MNVRSRADQGLSGAAHATVPTLCVNRCSHISLRNKGGGCSELRTPLRQSSLGRGQTPSQVENRFFFFKERNTSSTRSGSISWRFNNCRPGLVRVS